ncbi:hypothetical protein HZA86_04585 [Candidatus Uhrbacteria bacterium]|nr:hypothetical protein [Candidatus Uhrbacteria bacterium]
MKTPPPIIEWEITKAEWRDRYRQYLPVMMPIIVAANMGGLLLLSIQGGWTAVYAGGVALFGIQVLILLYILWDYSTLPHRYILTEQGITVVRRTSTKKYGWSDFAGYLITQQVAAEVPASFGRGRTFVAPHQMESAMAKSRAVFGTIYQLVKPWGYWTYLPALRSIIVVAEPEVEDAVGRVITANLKQLSLKKLNTASNDFWTFVIAGIIIAVILGYAISSSP